MFRLNMATMVMEDDGIGDGVKTDDIPSMTKQSFAEEVDINTIVRRFGIGVELPVNVPMVTNGDFVGILNFQDAMDMVVKARESFMLMPADVRTRFHNDVHEFVEFVSDEANLPEANKLGLVSSEVAARLATEAQDQSDLLELGRVARAAKDAQKAPQTP